MLIIEFLMMKEQVWSIGFVFSFCQHNNNEETSKYFELECELKKVSRLSGQLVEILLY